MRIGVIGLGYVGLPLAVALAEHFPTVGYDLDAARVDELRAGRDRTGEVDNGAIARSTLEIAAEARILAGVELFIVTVPTPVDGGNRPDLSALLAACDTIAAVIEPGATVVFESTVYPGVTEKICGPRIAEGSGLRLGVDFLLGYSPERMNPGDKAHTVRSIPKVVAGQSAAVAERLAAVYGRINGGQVFIARDIMTAEAAKAIENAQRDINIAFVNEVAVLCGKLGLSVYDVLDAARTKWNFLPFTPGLVGGHCIGVDPYYLAHCAQSLGHDPEVVLVGRRINDRMGEFVGEMIAAKLKPGSNVLVLGLTFKENVRDLRNTKSIDVIRCLRKAGHTVHVHDVCADPAVAKRLLGVDLVPSLDAGGPYDALIGLVPHDAYVAMGAEDFERLVRPEGLIADVKGMWRAIPPLPTLERWQL